MGPPNCENVKTKSCDDNKSHDGLAPAYLRELFSPTGTRLAHFYGLPKTHKDRLAMRPILSATQTYNYALAKWLDTNLKPLSLNRYTVTDIFDFANEIRSLEIANGDILVSYDVSSLFTNVPLDETIQLLRRTELLQTIGLIQRTT